MADRFASRGYSLKKQTRWSNDKTIIELGYCKISWFVGQLFAEAELICSPETNYDILLNLVQLLFSILQFIQAWFFFQTSCYCRSKLARLRYDTSMTWLLLPKTKLKNKEKDSERLNIF